MWIYVTCVNQSPFQGGEDFCGGRGALKVLQEIQYVLGGEQLSKKRSLKNHI